jgi:hypothetical protein
MGYRDSQRFRKVYGYYRPQPKPVDTGFTIDKNYVDEALQSLDWKQSVRAASTTSVSLNSPGLVDGVTLAEEDRVLLKNQSTGSENGIYIYYSASDALVRTLDAAQDSLTSGAAVYVEEGSLNSQTVWILSTYDPIVVGTTNLTWVQFPNASSISIFTQTGSYAKTTFSVSFDGSYTSQKGNDVFFFVSGTIGDIANKKISVFGGDLLVSGGLKVGDDINAESFFIRTPGSSLNSTPVGSITGSIQGIVLSSSQDIRFTVNSGSYNLATINDPSNYNYVFGTGSLVESILSAKYDGYSYYRKGFLFGSNVSISGTLDVSSIGTLRPGWNDERDTDIYYNGIMLNDGSAITGDYEFIDNHTVLLNTTSVGPIVGGDIITVVIKNADGAPYGMSYVPPPAVTMGGDVSGDSNSATVTRIRNRVVSPAGPTNGDIYIFNAYQNQWVPSGSIVTALFAGSGLNASKTTGSISINIDDSILATLSGATFTGPVNFNEGLSGSLTSLTDGSPYLIAGSNIIIATQSNGAISISSTASGTGGDSFFQSSINDSIFTTGSVAIRGTNSLISSSYNAGSDVFFYVSGSTNVSGSSAKIALFGGDLVTSGSISVSNGGSIVGNLTAVNNVGILGDLNVMSDALIAGDITGSFGLKIASGSSFGGVARFESGLSGSLTKLRDGSSYLIAGSNIIISSASNGAVTISSTASGTGGDSFFQSLVTGSIFTTGSVAIRGANTLISSSYSVGSDVFFYVSGSTNVTGSTAKVALFGGDIVTSGSISVSNGGSVVGNLTAVNNVGILGDLNVMSDALIAGDITGSASLRIASGSTFNGPAKFNSGLSGSLTNLPDGSSYIRAGSNITVSTSSNGSLTISSTASGESYFNSTTQGSIFTTGSVSFSGNQAGIDAPSDIGNDVFFYVSGSIGSKNTSTQGTAVFGGDVRVSGSLTVGTGSVTITSNDIQFGDSATKIEKSGNNLKISLSGGNLLIASGSISSNSGLTGSLTSLSDGTPYLLAGNGISITTGSLGAITITNDGTVGDITGVTAGTGLTGGGLSGSVSLAINNSIVATVSGTTFTGATKHNAGLSGSLTSLTDGTSYLIAGSNLTISTGSNGAVTINSLSASYINSLNQNVAITGSLTVGSTIADTPSTENTLNLYPPVGAPSNEGGQLLLAAPGGLYTSASMLDTFQNTFRILKGTNTNGSSTSYFNLDLNNGNITTVGSITPGSYNSGDIIQMRAFKPGDSGVYTAGTAATSNSNECFFSCSFTPRSTTSYLVVEMCAKYECTGASGNDDYLSTLTINGPSGTEIGFSYQIFSLVGGGDRSGVLFPLTGRYTNTSTTAKTICANVRRSTADDNIVFDNDNQGSMTMVVTEIGR